MGDSYEYLIKKFADLSKKNAAEFYTPRSIVKLLTRILDPKPGETVYDPACGTGGMLIEAIHRMNNDKKSYGKIYGQEKNLATSAIARMNLFLHGAKDFNILQGDTLRNPLHIYRGQLKTFDCVIANPPFSLENWGADAFASDVYGRNLWGCPSDSCADFAWLQHMVKSMDKNNGRCAVVLPQGVLFREGQEQILRQKLINSDKIEAIIIFATGLFFNTGVPACTLVLNNNKKQEHKRKICLINASKIYTPKRAQNIMLKENINEIYELYKNYKNEKEKCKIISIEDTAKYNYSLSANLYIEHKKEQIISSEIVKQDCLSKLSDVIKAEDKFKALLIKGGYLNEQ